MTSWRGRVRAGRGPRHRPAAVDVQPGERGPEDEPDRPCRSRTPRRSSPDDVGPGRGRAPRQHAGWGNAQGRPRRSVGRPPRLHLRPSAAERWHLRRWPSPPAAPLAQRGLGPADPLRRRDLGAPVWPPGPAVDRAFSLTEAPSHMGYPTPVGRSPLLELHDRHSTAVLAMSNGAPPAASGTDVVDGQVRGSVGGALVARAPVAVHTTPGTQHADAEPLPGPRAVEGVVPATVGVSGVLGTSTIRAAGDHTTDRAQLHPRIVGGMGGRSIRLRC